ncbi:hypothetical protein HK101_009010 [Irineochytrium annulatum]|nr:hypothetical protein HK101_009010 [Irineochytrium annulatum]
MVAITTPSPPSGRGFLRHAARYARFLLIWCTIHCAVYGVLLLLLRLLYQLTCLGVDDLGATRPYADDAVVFGFLVVVLSRVALAMLFARNRVLVNPTFDYLVAMGLCLAVDAVLWVAVGTVGVMEYVWAVSLPVNLVTMFSLAYVTTWKRGEPFATNLRALAFSHFLYVFLIYMDMTVMLTFFVVVNQRYYLFPPTQLDLNTFLTTSFTGVVIPIVKYMSLYLYRLLFKIDFNEVVTSRKYETILHKRQFLNKSSTFMIWGLLENLLEMRAPSLGAYYSSALSGIFIMGVQRLLTARYYYLTVIRPRTVAPAFEPKAEPKDDGGSKDDVTLSIDENTSRATPTTPEQGFNPVKIIKIQPIFQVNDNDSFTRSIERLETRTHRGTPATSSMAVMRSTAHTNQSSFYASRGGGGTSSWLPSSARVHVDTDREVEGSGSFVSGSGVSESSSGVLLEVGGDEAADALRDPMTTKANTYKFAGVAVGNPGDLFPDERAETPSATRGQVNSSDEPDRPEALVEPFVPLDTLTWNYSLQLIVTAAELASRVMAFTIILALTSLPPFATWSGKYYTVQWQDLLIRFVTMLPVDVMFSFGMMRFEAWALGVKWEKAVDVVVEASLADVWSLWCNLTIAVGAIGYVMMADTGMFLGNDGYLVGRKPYSW